MRQLIVILAFCFSYQLAAQTDRRQRSVENRVREYAGEPHRPLVIDTNAAAALLRGAHAPRIIEVGTPELGGAPLPGAARTTPTLLLDQAGRAPSGTSFLVISHEGLEAIEAAVMLRLAGYDATALRDPGENLALRLRGTAQESPRPAGTVEVPAPAAAAPVPSLAPAPEPAPVRTSTPPAVWVGVGLLVVLVLALGGHLLILAPRKKRRALLDGLRAIEQSGGEDGKLREAEKLLGTATDAGGNLETWGRPTRFWCS